MPATIFYSWQSDLPNATNRGFIERALEAAIDSIRADGSIEVDPALDRDTVGVPGAPDIAATIFEKIDQAAAFVCDVSPITDASAARPCPNPNVLVELGYALKVLGWERIVMVLNTAYGRVEDLPFDLRRRRALTYESRPEDESRAPERRRLQAGLAEAVRSILGEGELRQQETTPDVRVIVQTAIAGYRGAPSRKFLRVEVQNHSPLRLFLSAITLECADGSQLYSMTDMATMERQYARTIEPGDAVSQHFDLPALLGEADAWDKEIITAVATDKIGRKFRSQPGLLAKVLKQLA